MTSIPVKDVGSLMNFVGAKQPAGTLPNQADGFGDIMNKTQSGGGNNNQAQQAAAKQTDKNVHQNAYESRKDAVKRETARMQSQTKDTGTMQESVQAAQDAGSKMVEEVAGEFDLSEEDVIEAMEVLGLSAVELLEPANLTQLVVELSGEQDNMSLLTNEDLFGKLQNLLQDASLQKDALAQELDLDPEQLQSLLGDVKEMEQQAVSEQEVEMSQPDLKADTSKEADSKASKITVEVHSGDETVTMTADENGNVEKTLSVTQQGERSAKEQGHETENGKGREHEGTFHSGNPVLDGLLQNRAADAQPVTEQPAPMFSQQTQEIMDQILDYMKIQLRPETDQLEMQLHPASLGSVHIQLNSKGGEVTAQFQVQSETVKAVLESQLVELKESLREQGVKVEAVQVTVESHGFESNLWQGQENQQDAASRNGASGRGRTRRINLSELEAGFEEDASEEEILAAKLMEANGNTVDYTA